MQHQLLVGMVLDITHQYFAGFPCHFHFENGGVKSFFLQGVPQRIVVEFNQLWGVFTTINDARGFASIAQAAARTRTLLGALEGDDFHGFLQFGAAATSRRLVSERCPVPEKGLGTKTFSEESGPF